MMNDNISVEIMWRKDIASSSVLAEPIMNIPKDIIMHLMIIIIDLGMEWIKFKWFRICEWAFIQSEWKCWSENGCQRRRWNAVERA